MRQHYTVLLSLALPLSASAQILLDSIPLPGLNQGFWGIHVTTDTIYLGSDFSGDVYFLDHEGTVMGQQATGFDYNHGLIKGATSYVIAQDYTTDGAGLHEVDLEGNLINTWTFPDVIGGPSSGIGDLEADGDAVWYTMYYPDFDVYPYAYAYKWVPGDAAPIDTVPMNGEQPYGLTRRADTLYYVTDNLNGNPERIYAYDLANGTDIGYVELPDPDGDQSPRGLHYDGTHLYLLANRLGGASFAYQTIYIYGFDAANAQWERATTRIDIGPNPADGSITISPSKNTRGPMSVHDATGRLVHSEILGSTVTSIDVSTWEPGAYVLRLVVDGVGYSRRFVVAR